MKLKHNYVLTEIGSDIVAVPVGVSDDSSRRVVKLNATAAEIWRGIEQEKSVEEIALKLTEKYDGIDYISALEYVNGAVNKLFEAEIVAE